MKAFLWEGEVPSELEPPCIVDFHHPLGDPIPVHLMEGGLVFAGIAPDGSWIRMADTSEALQAGSVLLIRMRDPGHVAHPAPVPCVVGPDLLSRPATSLDQIPDPQRAQLATDAVWQVTEAAWGRAREIWRSESTSK